MQVRTLLFEVEIPALILSNATCSQEEGHDGSGSEEAPSILNDVILVPVKLGFQLPDWQSNQKLAHPRLTDRMIFRHSPYRC